MTSNFVPRCHARDMKSYAHIKNYVQCLWQLYNHQRWKQSKCPSIGEWMKQVYILTMELCLATERKELLKHLGWTSKTPHKVTEAGSKRLHILQLHLHEMSPKGKFIGTESRLVVIVGWGWEQGLAKDGGITRVIERVLKLD